MRCGVNPDEINNKFLFMKGTKHMNHLSLADIKTTDNSIGELNTTLDAMGNINMTMLTNRESLKNLLQTAVESACDYLHYCLEISSVDELYHEYLDHYNNDASYPMLQYDKAVEDLLLDGSAALYHVSSHFSYLSGLAKTRMFTILRFIMITGDDTKRDIFGCGVNVALADCDDWLAELYESLGKVEYNSLPGENYKSFLKLVRAMCRSDDCLFNPVNSDRKACA